MQKEAVTYCCSCLQLFLPVHNTATQVKYNVMRAL